MAINVSPLQQNIDVVFSNVTYWIDFYQREYKWTKDPVVRLLDDVFYKFNLEYENKKDLDPKAEVVAARYPWYYLNTYVTNIIDGRTYVVDGQQRLTTLSLILIKLFHISTKYSSKLKKWIESKIVGTSGYEQEFWMNHVKHKNAQELLMDGTDIRKIDISSGITAKNMIENYAEISKYLDENLYDKHKFETFVFFFLHRLVLINLLVDQTDVPMVFEVINDRGVKLKSHEILKGKLLGQIDKLELESGKYNEMWEKTVVQLNERYENEIDLFFNYFLKAKYANTRKEGQRFEENYHREMFMPDIDRTLRLNHNPSGVKTFLNNEFRYYSGLHKRIVDYYYNFSDDQPYVFYNKLNDMDNQFLLIHSCCKIHDDQEGDKINKVSYHLDRAFSLLQLQSCYDSNSFNDMLYGISKDIRECSLEDIDEIFNRYILLEIGKQRNAEVSNLLSYTYFKNAGINLNTRFKRYFFARVEKLLADNVNLKMKHNFEDLVSKTGSKSGFHIEHVLSYNDENLELFANDEDLFEQERNRLGGILLLKGKDNISSGNESFKRKLKSYSNTLYWNESLRDDFYKSKLDFSDFMKRAKLSFRSMETFGPDELEERHKLLFNISKIIWK